MAKTVQHAQSNKWNTVCMWNQDKKKTHVIISIVTEQKPDKSPHHPKSPEKLTIVYTVSL